ncbi:peptidoglycan-binding protein [Dyella ginsengisoli]|uniref:Peptidoglycan-binding protein n=1 Tax=Dyella ginsengisoli TaxID=363848 RepID=A0ABW8JTB2_9GAMM
MPNLDTHNLDAMSGATYFVVGRGTEGGPASYRLSIAGITAGTSDPNWGHADRIKANSGYSIGTIQVDLGQRGAWALGSTDGGALKPGETTYVDAIIGQASAYAKAHALPFTQDQAQLRADLLSHGNGKEHRGTLAFIDTDTRDSINAWASSEEGEKWIHKNIDYPQVKNATQTAMDMLDQNGKNVPEDHRLEAIAILAKTANQMPSALKTYEKVLKDGGDYSDVLATANDIHRRLDWYDGPKAAAIAKQYKQAHDDPTVAAAIDRAHTKVGDADFNPLKSANDPDIEQALKAIGQGHRSHHTVLHQGSHGHAVVALQTELAQLGFTDSHGHRIKHDGDFGPSTRFAVETFQRKHSLKADGIVGHDTAEALKHATLQQTALTALTLDHHQHPGHPMFQQALAGVGQLDQAQGRATDFRSYNLSGALALAARKEGLERIDQVILSEDASRAIAVQGDIRSPLRRFADVDVVSGVSTPLAQSSTDWSQFQTPGMQSVQAPTPLMQSADAQVAQPSMQR